MKELQYKLMSDDNAQQSVSIIADMQSSPRDFVIEAGDLDTPIPILPARNMVIFPKVFHPILIGRPSSLRLVKAAEHKNALIGVFCQKKADVENPQVQDLYSVGVVARVSRIFEMPGGHVTAIVHALYRARLGVIVDELPYLRGRVRMDSEIEVDEKSDHFKMLLESIRDTLVNNQQELEIVPELAFNIRTLPVNSETVSVMCSNLRMDVQDKILLLEKNDVEERMFSLLQILGRQVKLAQIKASIQQKAKQTIDQQQRTYFLQQQMKMIQDELGISNGVADAHDEALRLRRIAVFKEWNDNIKEIFNKELLKFEKLYPQNGEYATMLTYLETMLAVPWGQFTKDTLNLKKAQRTLNSRHYGLEKVKERILEHLAVLKLKGNMKSPILCFYGPPGVGKTSLGRSIAEAMGRKYVRISLGGMHDESEIRGHRRTYIGAMPGQIVKSLIKAKSYNPVFVLDEIDKVCSSHNGDPSAALLEVLDPEQNNAFHDNYLEVDVDLSHVMFIATANDLSTIPKPLLDRLELIEVSSYITEEKVEIARKHLVPKQMEENGMKKENVKFSKAALEAIVEDYTRESGVRQLEKMIGKVLRKVALKYALDETVQLIDIKPDNLTDYLGMKLYSRDKYQGNEYAGVVTGLAWTAVGGEILFVETSLSKGKGGRLTLTGNLGDVMKESAMLALEFIKAHASLLQIDQEVFDNWNIHIHVPEGAIPKDGPSAGITMATSIASALTQRKVKAGIAMTGEITLRGKVLPVGGIREKILAAKRAGIKEVILCEENRKDIEEIEEIYLKGLTFHYVNNVKEVFEIALLKSKVADPIDLTVPKEEHEEKSEK